MTFYERYIELCAKNNKTPSAVALENHLSKSAVNAWKVGRSKPTDITLSKLADYFGVSVEYLKGESDIKEKTALVSEDGLPKNAKSIQYINDYSKFPDEKQEFILAALKEFMLLPPEKQQQALSYIRFLKEQDNQ